MASVRGLALVANRDGFLELAAATGVEGGAPPGRVWYARQTSPNGDWTGWQPLDAPPVHREITAPAAAHDARWCLDVVVASDDGTVWLRGQTDPSGREWSDWRSLGRPGGETPPPEGIGAPVLATNQDGRLEIFVVRLDRPDVPTPHGPESVWHAWQEPDGDWSGWRSLGRPGSGVHPDMIAVAPNFAGRLELFVTEGNQHAIWHRWQQPGAPDGWAPWASLGAPPGDTQPTTPVLGRSSDGHVLLFTVATDKTVRFRRKPPTADSGWTAWERVLGRDWYEQVGVGMHRGAEAAGHLLVVATSQENRLWHTQQRGGSFMFEDWRSFGSSTFERPGSLDQPTLAANADGRLELFLLSSGGDLYQYTQTGTSELEPLPAWSEGRVWPRPGEEAPT